MNKTLKLSFLFVSVLTATVSNAGVNFDTPQGKLSIGGNFEFNFDTTKLNSSLSDSKSNDSYFNSGRVELNINGEKELPNGNYGAFSLNPGWLIGGTAINDMWMGVGKKQDWFFKMGHFLNTDVVPVGLAPGDDTMVQGYEMYTLNDARGRSDNMATFDKFAGHFTYELGAVYNAEFGDHESTLNTLPSENATDYLYSGSGINVVKNKDPFVIRPIIAYDGGKTKAGLGGEISIVTDAYQSSNGVDLSKRTGVGGYIAYEFSPEFSTLVRTAYLDAASHDQYTLGLGVKYANIYTGYLFGHENVYKSSNLGINNKMQAESHEMYVSSVWKNFLDLTNVELHVGGYWTQMLAKNGLSADLEKPTDYGTRVRIKYWF